MTMLSIMIQALLLGSILTDSFYTISEKPDSVIQSELFYLEFFNDHIYSEELLSCSSEPYMDSDTFRIGLIIPKGLKYCWSGSGWTSYLFYDNSEIYVRHFESSGIHNMPLRHLSVYDTHKCNRYERADFFYYSKGIRFTKRKVLRQGYSLYIVRGDVADIYILARRSAIKRIIQVILSGCRVFVNAGQVEVIGKPKR